MRGLAIRSGAFESVPQRSRLGRIKVGTGRQVADLILRRKARGKHPRLQSVIVEVKNRRSWCYSRSDLYAVLLSKALLADAIPMLCASHAPAEARVFCKAIGIALITLDRQLAPKSRRRQIQKLRPVVGSRAIEFVGERFYQNSPLPSLAVRDLSRIGSTDWLDEIGATWLTNRIMVFESLRLPWWDARTSLLSSLGIASAG